MALIERAMPLSGGAGLNFSIVGGTEEPTNPKENTIWVNTDVAISEWQFSGTEPATRIDGTDLQTGDVWIGASNESTISLNILKKNGIILNIGTAKQYIDGEWVKVSLKIYYNGEWRKNILYLYNEGDLCTDITGDWIGGDYGEGTSNTSQAKNSDHLYLNVGSSNLNSRILYFTNNLIDITGYSKLCARVVATASGDYSAFTIGLVSEYGDGVWNGTWAAGAGSPAQQSYDGIVELDISGFSGSYYIGLRSFKYSIWTGVSLSSKTYKVWLE